MLNLKGVLVARGPFPPSAQRAHTLLLFARSFATIQRGSSDVSTKIQRRFCEDLATILCEDSVPIHHELDSICGHSLSRGLNEERTRSLLGARRWIALRFNGDSASFLR